MRKRILKIFICVLLALCTVLILFVVAGSKKIFKTSSKRPTDKNTKKIEQIRSENDTDGDGIDDQTDILNGALKYIETKPKYESRYYSSGYPDDGYGVCTDVVAQAFLAAGFDLKELVATDLKKAPYAYDIEEPDENIDFRRVKNLKVYFKRHAESLTTDVNEVEEWQGGDVVIFEKHIGIVSDRRNRNGVPYVIHHANPYQKRYEQDILEKRDDIVGHYRMP